MLKMQKNNNIELYITISIACYDFVLFLFQVIFQENCGYPVFSKDACRSSKIPAKAKLRRNIQ